MEQYERAAAKQSHAESGADLVGFTPPRFLRENTYMKSDMMRKHEGIETTKEMEETEETRETEERKRMKKAKQTKHKPAARFLTLLLA